MTAREAAALLGSSSVMMSQIESGVAGVSEARVRRLASHYACAETELIDALVVMATDRTCGWWEEYRGVLPVAFLDLSELEHHATFRRDVDFTRVPGLLQTEEYARAVFAYRVPTLPQADLEARVAHRMARRVITEESNPTPYQAVVHEAALRIRVGTRAAARTQLAWILEMLDARLVTVRIIPFDLDCFAGASSAMAYVGGALPRLDTVVSDAPNGTGYIDAETQLANYRTLFRRLEGVSLAPDKSRDFIHRLSKEL